MFINVGENLVTVVLAAVVHKHHFVGLADGVHHFGQLHVQRWDALLFVEERDHDGIVDGSVSSHTTGRKPFLNSHRLTTRGDTRGRSGDYRHKSIAYQADTPSGDNFSNAW